MLAGRGVHNINNQQRMGFDEMNVPAMADSAVSTLRFENVVRIGGAPGMN